MSSSFLFKTTINSTAIASFNSSNLTVATWNTTDAPTLIDVDSDEYYKCSFCPNTTTSSEGQVDDGQEPTVPFPDRAFINVTDETCGSLQALFLDLNTLEECQSTRAIFQTTFYPAVYCACPGTVEMGICTMCPDQGPEGTNDLIDRAKPINGVTCGAYADLAKATLDMDFCQGILDVEGIQEACCQFPDWVDEIPLEQLQQQGNNADTAGNDGETTVNVSKSDAFDKRVGKTIRLVAMLGTTLAVLLFLPSI